MGSFPTAEEITRDWGERCPDYDSECSCCQMWGMHAETERLRAEVERLTQSRDEWIEAAVKQQKAAKWARAEERERAAQIAEAHLYIDWSRPRKDQPDPQPGHVIAAAIRASKDAGGGE